MSFALLQRNCIGALTVVLALGLASGCTTIRPTAEDKAAVWLAEAPRAISVKVHGELPSGSVRVLDHKVGERVGKGLGTGALVAARTVLTFCAGGPVGCAVGAFAAPFGLVLGGVGGAMSVNSEERSHGLQEARGAVELYEKAMKPIDVTAELGRAVIVEAGRQTPHRYLPGVDPAAGRAEAQLRLSIQAIDLAGDVGDDARVCLVLVAHAALSTPAASLPGFGEFSYRGGKRRLSEWLKDDAQLFREEVGAASRSIAKDVALRLGWRPGRAVFDGVAAEREQRAAASAAAALHLDAPSAVPTAAAPALPSEGDRFVYRLSDPRARMPATTQAFRVKAVSPAAIVESYGGPNGSEREWTHTDRGYVVNLGVSVFSPYFAATGDAQSPARLAAVQDLDRATCALYWTCASRLRVVGRERVTVPAGAFEALKLELRQDWSSGNYGARRQMGERVLAVWYAPEVKRAIKFSSRQKIVQGDALADDFDLELVAYEAAR